MWTASIPDDGFCSIVPGYRYQGCAMPGYRGTFFYADRSRRELRYALKRPFGPHRVRELVLLPTELLHRLAALLPKFDCIDEDPGDLPAWHGNERAGDQPAPLGRGPP